jgi:nitrite reductase/ring-hydroxylating ferredoxin subunit
MAIQRALEHALVKPSGGWFVLDATRNLLPTRSVRFGRGKNPIHRFVINDREYVAAIDPTSQQLVVASAVCPHMGAHLGDGTVSTDGCFTCPWHGLKLPMSGDIRVSGQGSWDRMRAYDDGVLTWIQPNPNDVGATDAPILPTRPDRFFDAVIRRDGTCEPRDVIANRLDPWHGVHFHPYAFASLEVLAHCDDFLDLRVGYRVTPKHVMTVEARFDCPEPRTIVMTITGGEGTGSIVETHATPVHPHTSNGGARTTVIEATLATSERPGFAQALKGIAVARPAIRFLANRLWVDDIRYAERLYQRRCQTDTKS